MDDKALPSSPSSSSSLGAGYRAALKKFVAMPGPGVGKPLPAAPVPGRLNIVGAPNGGNLKSEVGAKGKGLLLIALVALEDEAAKPKLKSGAAGLDSADVEVEAPEDAAGKLNIGIPTAGVLKMVGADVDAAAAG
jgi:hypothetical protein